MCVYYPVCWLMLVWCSDLKLSYTWDLTWVVNCYETCLGNVVKQAWVRSLYWNERHMLSKMAALKMIDKKGSVNMCVLRTILAKQHSDTRFTLKNFEMYSVGGTIVFMNWSAKPLLHWQDFKCFVRSWKWERYFQLDMLREYSFGLCWVDFLFRRLFLLYCNLYVAAISISVTYLWFHFMYIIFVCAIIISIVLFYQ